MDLIFAWLIAQMKMVEVILNLMLVMRQEMLILKKFMSKSMVLFDLEYN
jgi:hypothetical protein